MPLVPTPAPLEASRRVTSGIPLGRPLFLPVHTVNCVYTLKAPAGQRPIYGESNCPRAEQAVHEEFGPDLVYGRFQEAWNARYGARFDRIFYSRMPLVPTPARLKLLDACDPMTCLSALTVATVNSVESLKVRRHLECKGGSRTWYPFVYPWWCKRD
jgi:hypothetical protein